MRRTKRGCRDDRDRAGIGADAPLAGRQRRPARVRVESRGRRETALSWGADNTRRHHALVAGRLGALPYRVDRDVLVLLARRVTLPAETTGSLDCALPPSPDFRC